METCFNNVLQKLSKADFMAKVTRSTCQFNYKSDSFITINIKVTTKTTYKVFTSSDEAIILTVQRYKWSEFRTKAVRNDVFSHSLFWCPDEENKYFDVFCAVVRHLMILYDSKSFKLNIYYFVILNNFI